MPQILRSAQDGSGSGGGGGGRAAGQPDVGPAVAAEIRGSMSAGTPLPLSVRRFMEPRFGVDFGGVRVHADERAAGLNRQVSARAFTYGNHIFFGRDEYRPDSSDGRELIAHELTHTVQQGGAVRRSAVPTAVEERREPQVQRLGISDALDYFAERANHIPGFRMFTLVLGVNPINMRSVERTGANLLRAAVEFIPGGGLITRVLDQHGIIDRVAGWVGAKFRELGMVGSAFRRAIMDFLDSLSWRDVFRLGDVWNRGRRIITEPIDRLLSFARSLGSEILGFIRDAVVRPLARLAEGTRGYDLIKAVLGEDPITGDPYPRNADTLIGGFMKLIGQEEVWQNIKRANAVARAWAWFQGAVAGLIGMVRALPGQFMAALRSLELADFLVIPRAFAKVGRVFLSAAGQFFSWAGAQVLQLLQIIFEVVAPGAMPYLRRTGAALASIFRNPIPFLGNLVRAGILGFRNFATNFLTHLRGSIIGWLTGAMAGAGVHVPQAFTLPEIIKFVLSVLGVTWQNIRQKIVRVVGEPAMRAMETGFELITTLVTRGPAALWERIREAISNLREMVMEQVMSFVQTRIVQAAITRLVTSLNPAGAFIQAVIAIYNTVMFFVERLRQIAQVAMAFVDSMVAIASGNITAAAQRVERTMAGMLTLVVSFLARLVGLGRVSDAVKNVIDRVRAPIDRALDRAVEWIVAQARRLGRLVATAGVPQDPQERMRLARTAALAAARGLQGRISEGALARVLDVVRVRYGLRVLAPFQRDGVWWIRAVNSPEVEFSSDLPAGETGEWPVRVGDPIIAPENRANVATVEAIDNPPNSITYSVRGLRVTKGRRPFMEAWTARRIYLASSAGSERIREHLVSVYGVAVADAVMSRGALAAALEESGVGHAHHIIPVGVLKGHPMLHRLVSGGWNFNAAVNGVLLSEGFHGNHPNYNIFVMRQIEEWMDARPGSPPATLVDQFRTFITAELIPRLRTHIQTAEAQYAAEQRPDRRVNLNAYFARLL